MIFVSRPNKRVGKSVILVCKWKKCSVLNWVCERGTIYQLKVYGRGTFSVKNAILKGKGLDLGAEPLKTLPDLSQPCIVSKQITKIVNENFL